MSSSALLLSFNPLTPWLKPLTKPSDFHDNGNLLSCPVFSKPSPSLSLSLSKSHICFAFSNNDSSNYESEEARWLREEQRWLREEQRWLRQESRWEAERESLLNEIEGLKAQVEELKRKGDGNYVANVPNLLQVLKKEVSQIAESGSSAAPLVVEAKDVEEVVVKEVVKVFEERVKDEAVKKKERQTLRVGSEGDAVQEMQEALQKLGFYSGEEDMEFASFSSGTERAVKTWQASLGVPETGMMTSELLEILYMEHKKGASGFKDGANGAAVSSVTQISEVQQSVVKEDGAETGVSEHRVFLLGENRWEDSSRLKGRNKQGSQSQTTTKAATVNCLTCHGEGRLMCIECDGTGEPNIEPQFLEWVDESLKCPYCEGLGYTVCDVCKGKTATAA